MPVGMRLPVQADSTGGTSMVEGEEDNRQVIKIALSDCDNDHAFQQDLGLGTSMIFDINDPGLRARVLKRVTEIFSQFEAQDRFRLLTDTIRWTKGNGELILEFMYHDIESDEELPFARNFTSAS